jgi:hypothetical protein
MSKFDFWKIPELWPGETFAILAGGPSMTQKQADTVKGRCRVIAVNNTYQLAPWADVLYGCDKKWWSWHPDAVDFKGIKITMSPPPLSPKIHLVRNGGVKGLCLDKDGLATGRNGGYQAINLAFHLGAKRIILLGYDMRVHGDRVHWHPEHKVPTPPTVFKGFLANYETIVDPLREQGVEVFNCTPGSSLKVFPVLGLDEAVEKYGQKPDSIQHFAE